MMKAGRLESPPAGPPPGTSLRASPPPGDPLQGLGLGSAACRSQGRARARRFLFGVGQTAGPFRLATFWETRVETMARCREGFVSPNFSVGKAARPMPGSGPRSGGAHSQPPPQGEAVQVLALNINSSGSTTLLTGERQALSSYSTGRGKTVECKHNFLSSRARC